MLKISEVLNIEIVILLKIVAEDLIGRKLEMKKIKKKLFK